MHDEVKAYKTYEEQVELLVRRGMDVGDRDRAAGVLARINYYRLSGYWYPFRQLTNAGRGDDFFRGTRLDDIVALYEFDARLRAATFSVLAPIELTFRALLGHELGRIDPCAHLNPALLGPTARNRVSGESESYRRWREGYERGLGQSREDFVEHHRLQYGGRPPVWASWLKTLNLLRNACAHHGRLFNRVHTITPRLSKPAHTNPVLAQPTRTRSPEDASSRGANLS